MKKILIIIVVLGIGAVIVGIVMQNHRLEAQRDSSLQPPADVLKIGLVQPSVACASFQDHLKDKKLSEVLQKKLSEMVQDCKAMGY